MGIKKLIKGILEEKENRDYRQRLQQKRMSYQEWAAAEEAREAGREGRKGRTDISFVVFQAGKGRLAPAAYEAMGDYFASHPEVQLLYGDEDVCQWSGDGELANRESPWYKPDWSPELLDSFFYFGSVVALRREFLEKSGVRPEAFGVRKEEDDYGYIVKWEIEDLAAFEKAVGDLARLAGGYGKKPVGIGHVQEILFHGESREIQDRFLELSAHSERLKTERPVGSRDGRGPTVSVIVPSKDQPEALESCLKSCLASAGEGREAISVEIVIVDNGSSGENREKIGETICHMEVGKKHPCRIRYLYEPEEFNFSKMCNRGAAVAEGDFLLFLNDDVELCQPDTLERMAAMAAGDGIGAVGLKLYYPGSRRIQHAGITNLPIGPVHKLQFLEDDRCYYYGANRGNHDVLAVTAACLMVRKDRYQEVGGFPEDLKIAFNDVDFCFCLYEAGYRNVCMNDIWAYHHESLSRGDDESEEKIRRLEREREKLYDRHPGLEGTDPYYSALLNREYLDTGIRPGFLTAGNRMQRVSSSLKEAGRGAETGNGTGPQIGRLPWESARPRSGYRQDQCVLIRIEDCRGSRVFGYGVVLGDDNACYDRALLLWEAGKSRAIYALRLEEMYRPDLEENMPDQSNVALCGFDVEIGQGAVQGGRYRLGMAVRNRITGLGLLNWSNRFLEVRSCF